MPPASSLATAYTDTPTSSGLSFNQTLAEFQQAKAGFEDVPYQNGTTATNSALLQQFQSETSLRSASTDGRILWSADQAGVTPDARPHTPDRFAASNASAEQALEERVSAGSFAEKRADNLATAARDELSKVDASAAVRSGLAAADKGKRSRSSQPSAGPASSHDVAKADPSVAAPASGPATGQSPPSATTGSLDSRVQIDGQDPASGTSAHGRSANRESNLELAFAVRIGGDASPADNSGAGDPAIATGSAPTPAPANPFSALSALVPAAGKSPEKSLTTARSDDGAGLLGTSLAFPAAGAPGEPSAPANEAPEVAADNGPVPADSPAETDAVAQPLTTVQVQIAGAENERVNLRMTERSGALSISVRSADSTLTRSLQEHLPELSGKLNEQQLRTEWWVPAAHPVPPQKDSGSSREGAGGQAGTQDQGGQDNDGSRRQRNGAQPPDWVADLANVGKSNQNRTAYTWHL